MSSYIGDKLLSLVAQNKEGMVWAKWWCAETGRGAMYNLRLVLFFFRNGETLS